MDIGSSGKRHRLCLPLPVRPPVAPTMNKPPSPEIVIKTEEIDIEDFEEEFYYGPEDGQEASGAASSTDEIIIGSSDSEGSNEGVTDRDREASEDVITVESSDSEQPTIFCGVCGDPFFSQKCLKDHNKKEHSVYKVFVCPVCGKTLMDETKRMNHRKRCKRPTPPVNLPMCHRCGKFFPTGASLKSHIRTAHLKERELEVNLRLLPKEAILNAHLQGTELPPIALRKLPKSFESPSKVRKTDSNETTENLTTKESTAKENHKVSEKTNVPTEVTFCGVCGIYFLNEQNLKEHNQEEHSVFNVYLCTNCGRTFSRRTSLARHIMTDHQEQYLDEADREESRMRDKKAEEGNVVCSVCSKLFKGWNRLAVHMRTHEKKKEMGSNVCTECNRRYSRERDVRRHIRNVHPELDSNSKSLIRHIRNVHPELDSNSKSLIFKIVEQEFQPTDIVSK